MAGEKVTLSEEVIPLKGYEPLQLHKDSRASPSQGSITVKH